MVSHRLMSLALALLGATSAFAEKLGNNFEISGSGCRFPDVAFSTVSHQFLVVWADYNVGRIFGRFVLDTGAANGLPFSICEAPFGALYPAVAFNAINNEFLVTWDDSGNRGGVIYGQRVDGSTGTMVGTNFPIGSVYGGIRSAVAWSPVQNSYLVVYWGPSSGAPEVYGRRVSANGALLGANFNLSNDTPFSGYPAIAWGAPDQFLVTWDNEDGNIHGQRIDAATGAALGSRIIVTTGGGKDRSCIAYDSVNQRWLVQFNNAANAGFSYDQYGQLVNVTGTLTGGSIPLAHTPGFEGDTQFGGDVAFAPGARRFFSSFGTDTGMAGQESFGDGSPVGQQVVIGTGYYTSLNNAADVQRNRFLTVWEGMVGNSFFVLGQLYGATINPVTNFTSGALDGRNVLSWRNPDDVQFTGTLIKVSTSGYPATPADGIFVVDKTATPGANDSFTHTNLTNWTTYYYTAFAHDVGPNYSVAAQFAATPRPPVTTITSSDFEAGTDGWSFFTWAAGTGSAGTITREAASGSIVSTGSGASNNRDGCTREGSIMIKGISTAGRQSIQIEYDVMAALYVPPSGSPAGTCTPLEGSLDDKLVLSYSTAGTNGPWITGQVLSEGIELPTSWTRNLLNLAGIPAANNNTNFALRFQWQFNSVNDTGRVDNIRVLSGAVIAPAPMIGHSVANIERTLQAGQNLPNDIIAVNNSGEGILNFTASSDAAWLNVTPPSANSAGPPRALAVGYNTSALLVGDYETTIRLVSTNAANSPQIIAVKLHVIPPACFWEPFDYYDGNLILMGSTNWSGTATNQLLIDGRVLEIIGGPGQVSASHPLACAGSNGIVAAEIKIKRGNGSGDFFWNIALDDSGGNNLARWYGGSTIARGRVDGNITADMPLTGGSVWDDLYVRINPTSNSSEFFFNGVSFGTIPHNPNASNSVGSVRIERLDRSSANGDTILFDSLTLGAPDTSSPRLQMNRSGNLIVLSWPATGAGFQLQSATTLDAPVPWSPSGGTIVMTNGLQTFTTSTATGNRFFRLRRNQ
jgi:hypothetical protein